MTNPTNANIERTAAPPTAAELVRLVSATAATWIVLASVFVVWRRLAGAIAAPLPATGMLFAGALVAGLGWTARRSQASGRTVVSDLFISSAILALGLALSRGDGGVAGLIGFWIFVIGEELWTWRNKLPASLLRKGKRRSATAKGTVPFLPIQKSGQSPEDQMPVEPAADVMQQLTLRTTAEGGQELSGWLRMPLAAGQRTGTLHVAFCPPFDRAPQVEVEAVSGPDCRIKAAQPMPYGVRLEIKLDAPALEGDSVLVWFFAASKLD